MYEISLIRSVVNKYSDYDLISEENSNVESDDEVSDLYSLEYGLSCLALKFKELNEDSFHIASDMVKALYKILTFQNEQEIKIWAESLGLKDKGQESSLSKLYALSKDKLYRPVIIELQELFSGRCIELAAQYAASANNKVLRFTSVGKTEELQALEKERDLAKDTFEAVSNFCSRHRIVMS